MFEIFLAVLLCVAIVYGFILNRKLVQLRKEQANLDKLAKGFAQATSRAEANIHQLKATSDTTSETLNQAVKQASGIRDDLMYLIDRGNELADTLESGIRSKENHSVRETASSARASQTAVAESNKISPKGKAEKELIKALRAVR